MQAKEKCGMLKISDFSYVAHVSGRMLRHYDERGLLKPAYVDPCTGYRYYTLEQLPRLNRLLALKDLGFTLQQIAPMLAEDLPAAQLREMLRLKQAEVQHQLLAEQARLERIEARLLLLEKDPQPYEVVLKTVPALLVASTCGTIPDEADASSVVRGMFGMILDTFKSREGRLSRQRLLLWQNMNIDAQERQVEAAIPLAAVLAVDPPLQIYELPQVTTMACVVHHGSYRDLPQAEYALYRWIESNGFQVVGSGRELYLYGGTELNNPSYLTELQLPVKRS